MSKNSSRIVNIVYSMSQRVDHSLSKVQFIVKQITSRLEFKKRMKFTQNQKHNYYKNVDI